MSQEETKPSARPAEDVAKKNRKRVTVYFAVMFCVVILLLLLSFVMQQRNSSVLQNLNDSIALGQEYNTNQLENQQLKNDIAALEEDLEELQSELTLTQNTCRALEWLALISTTAQSDAEAAQELLAEFKASGLKKYLPQESLVEGSQAPSELYQALCRLLEQD